MIICQIINAKMVILGPAAPRHRGGYNSPAHPKTQSPPQVENFPLPDYFIQLPQKSPQFWACAQEKCERVQFVVNLPLAGKKKVPSQRIQ